MSTVSCHASSVCSWWIRSGRSFGGVAAASSATTYIESAAGVAVGGRTGLTSLVTAAGFFLALFLSPLAAIVPPQATLER